LVHSTAGSRHTLVLQEDSKVAVDSVEVEAFGSEVDKKSGDRRVDTDSVELEILEGNFVEEASCHHPTMSFLGEESRR
jgi:hypothetical protein